MSLLKKYPKGQINKQQKTKSRLNLRMLSICFSFPYYPEGNTCSFLYGYGQLKINEIGW